MSLLDRAKLLLELASPIVIDSKRFHQLSLTGYRQGVINWGALGYILPFNESLEGSVDSFEQF